MNESKKRKVLFVCLGNICRSPIAEAVFNYKINKLKIVDNWIVDSAAIGSKHVGRDPDYRALLTMKKNNLPYKNKARQITTNDFNNFDFIIGMDEANMNDLKRLAPTNIRAKLLMLGEFDTDGGTTIIKDPYFGKGAEGFKKCYEQCVRCCNGFLEKLDKNEL